MSPRVRIAFLLFSVLIVALGAHGTESTATVPAADYAFGPETWTETAAHNTATPKPRATCTVINGVSAYLGCKVTEGGSSTTYYNCTHNPEPCMDKKDCENCTNIPDDDN